MSSHAKRANSKSENNKRNSLLQALHRRGTASRLQLAKALDISNSRVCDLIEEMVAEDLLLEQAVTGDRRGRRGVAVRLNAGFGHVLGFDMEAKRLRLVVSDFSGQMVWQSRRVLRPVKNTADLEAEIFDFIDAGMKEIRPRFKNILGIGLAASGVMDHQAGVIIHYDPVPQAANFPMRDLIAKHLNLPCVMENNIRAMTLAEWTSGAAKGLHTFVCMAIRSGVGAGVVVNGRLLTGSHGFCGEVGYMVVPTAGSASGWKNLQQTVSETAMGVDVESKEFKMPDAAAKRAGELIGAQLATIAAILDPEAIVLAGGMLNPDGPVWLHAVSAFRQTALAELVERVRILPAQLGPFAAAVGAAHRCVYELFPVASPSNS
jgi:predicted NBD/HSP70 family sugar kinase